MATQSIEKDNGKTLYILELTPKETCDLIGLLAAQLAESPLLTFHCGACPKITVYEHGSHKCTWGFVVDLQPSLVKNSFWIMIVE